MEASNEAYRKFVRAAEELVLKDLRQIQACAQEIADAHGIDIHMDDPVLLGAVDAVAALIVEWAADP